jgi:hypothetical protein
MRSPGANCDSDAEGQAVFSPCIDAVTRNKLGLGGDLQLRWLSPDHERYLLGHRKSLVAH